MPTIKPIGEPIEIGMKIQPITRLDENTIQKTTIETIDLTPYKEQLKELEAMEEPSDAECLALGKRTHTFYTWRAEKILELKELIGE